MSLLSKRAESVGIRRRDKNPESLQTFFRDFPLSLWKKFPADDFQDSIKYKIFIKKKIFFLNLFELY